MSAAPALRVGFVGLGAMGAHLAHRLQAVGRVTVWDADPDAVARHVARYGTAPAPDLAALGAARPDVVGLCVPSLAQSREVCARLVDAGLADRGGPVVVVDHTSGDSLETGDLSRWLAEEHGVTYLDAPVSGGPAGAAAGTLTTMAGMRGPGHNPTVDTVLRAVAGRVVYLDTAGAGNAVKCVNNLLNATHLIVASQCMEALRRSGVDVSKALDAINGSSGRSLQTEVRIPVEAVAGRWDYGFQRGLMHKDVKQAARFLNTVLAGQEGAGAPSPEEARPWVGMVEEMLGRGDPHEDYTRVVEEYFAPPPAGRGDDGEDDDDDDDGADARWAAGQ